MKDETPARGASGKRTPLDRRSWLLLLFAATLAACAHRPLQAPRKPRATRRTTPSLPAVSGIYDWAAQTQDRYGDTHFEQEEWHLEQHGLLLRGFYDRAITYVSGDGRPYRCNQKLRFTRVARIDVIGTRSGDQLALRETAYRVLPNPCDDGGRSLITYTGQILAEGLTLTAARRVEQRLARRSRASGAHPSAATERDLFERARDVPERRVALDGAWLSELHTSDVNGDQRIEQEQWQLAETETGITGHYRSVVTHVRASGTYACNGSDHYQTLTRYEVQGQRSGDRFTLVETAYQATPSPCDNGARRLDSYRGVVFADSAGPQVVLSWGRLTQVLRRPSE